MKISGFFGDIIITEDDGTEVDIPAAPGQNLLDFELGSNEYTLNGEAYSLSDPYVEFSGRASELQEYMKELEKRKG